MEERIQQVLAEIRPAIARHLGDVEFVKFEGGVVYVRLIGACQNCPLSQLTLKAGVEELLRSRLVGVEKVEAVS